jgi:hypothetical protein
MNRRNLIVTTALAAVGLVRPAASASPLSCYSSAVPAPPLQNHTVVLIDRTIANNVAVTEAFRRAVIEAISDPGQRVTIASFAGLGNGELLEAQKPMVIEAMITDQRLIGRLPMRPFSKSQDCVRDRNAVAIRAAQAQLDTELARLDPKGHQQSEIVYALHEALAREAKPGVSLRVLVLSDGIEHSKNGQSFYGPDGRPRMINLKAELAGVPVELRCLPRRPVGPVRVVWWGLLVDDPKDSNARRSANFISTKLLLNLQSFWTTLLQAQWGVSDVQIGPTVINADLQFAGLKR